MLTSQYKRALFAFISFTVVAIAALSLALYNSGPRVRIVQFEKDPQATHLQRDSLITLSFDRPLEEKDYAAAISFQPQINFETRSSSQSITLTLKENLKHNTNYQLIVSPDIVDSSGNTMNKKYTYSFKTLQPSYMYIDRNYGPSNESPDAVLDNLMFSKNSKTPQSIFSHPEIVMFAANNKYAVAISKDKSGDQIHTINLETNNSRLEDWNLSARISDISISERGQMAVFTTSPNPSQITPSFSSLVYNKLHSLNLMTGEIQTVLDEDNQPIEAFSVELESYGQAALIRGPEQLFYIISPFSDYAPAPIGSFVSSFGFNNDSTEILFRDNRSFNAYSLITQETTTESFGDPNVLQSIKPSEAGSGYYSTLDFTSRRPESKLYQKTNTDKQLIWTSELSVNPVLKDFEPSYDNTFFALELNPESCFFDDIGANSKCKEVQTVIYDSSSGASIADVKGFDFTWLP